MAMLEQNCSPDGLTEINITPLVDVFLVLLIIVMVSANLLDHRSLELDLPSSKHASALPKTAELSMDATGQLRIDGQNVSAVELTKILSQMARVNPHRPVLVSVDQNRSYKDVIGLLDQAKSAGLTKAALKLRSQ